MAAHHLRERRLAAGLTQAALAERAAVPQPNISAYETGRRQPSADVLERLDRALTEVPSARLARHRERVREIVAAHKAHTPRLFGSAARGDDASGSDLDLVVEFEDDASLLDEVGLRLALEDLLEIPVDVVGMSALRGALRERVQREAVPL